VGLAITPRQRQRKHLWRELHRVAADDLRAVADEIAALEAREDDAYYEAVALHRDAEEKLATAQTLADLREVAALASRARGALAGAVDVPACFFDPAHGPSARQVVFAPDGGEMRQVPACDACAEEVDAGRAPDLRRVIVGGRPQPYWRSPVHSGYFGYGADTLDGLMAVLATETAFDASIGLLDLLGDLLDPTDLL
jgi:hypothetical protein